jgi:hypothetical protein
VSPDVGVVRPSEGQSCAQQQPAGSRPAVYQRPSSQADTKLTKARDPGGRRSIRTTGAARCACGPGRLTAVARDQDREPPKQDRSNTTRLDTEGFFRTDASYRPDLQAHLVDLLRNRERLRAAVDVDDWARAEAMPSDEEINRTIGCSTG